MKRQFSSEGYETMRKEIETIYDEMYQSIDRYLEKVRQLEQLGLSDVSEEEKERVQRMEFAMQAARDILENMMNPGKKLTLIYEKGSVELEVFDSK
jgi:23S rRNA pseudoU1915 N3-methylase RlmH